MAKNDGQIVIKKYANRRLYNTGTSTYVTLDDLAVKTRYLEYRYGGAEALADLRTPEDKGT